MSFHRRSFTVAITCISRYVAIRDRALVRIERARAQSLGPTVSRHSISSGANFLDAIYVRPAAAPREVVLICHGIAETIEHWFGVQQLLASHGVASLVFNYSGFGRSSGFIDWVQCEQDATSAFHTLQRLAPEQPITVLGFSMGSGIAAAVINQLPAHRLILCAAFTSFRHGARSVGLPAFLNWWVPPIWSAEESLRNCSIPILIVHGENDRLFPVQMAHNLKSICGANAELIIVPGLTHCEPFNKPALSYWGRLFPS